MPSHSKRKQQPDRMLWLIPLLIVAALAVAALVWSNRPRTPKTAKLDGYIDAAQTLETEYRHYHGQALRDESIVQQFSEAGRMVAQGNLPGAAADLEKLSEKAAVPVVFNNLGVLYTKLGDRARAINAFRDALSRDSGYVPVKENLRTLGSDLAHASDPVTEEVERNDNHLLANVIRLDAAVEAEIGGLNDADYFRFSSPPAPRDILEFRVEPETSALALGLGLYDSDQRFTAWGRESGEPGRVVIQQFSPAPNTTYYLHLWGHKTTLGKYSVLVKPLKAFDTFEPNDDIYSTSKIAPGAVVEASIMDDRDTDFFEFVAPRTGAVLIEATPRGDTLIPALSLFTPDRRTAGFGPDVRGPGQPLKHTMPVEEGRTYFFQVWSQANTSGAYRLSVR
jgi:hypothetical protein